MLKTHLIILLVLFNNVTLADGIGLGQPLPQLAIDDRGELVLDNDEFSFQPWELPAAIGKFHVVQYMAGTKGASELNKPFTDRLKEIAVGSYKVTTVINLDEAMWGTSGFVISELKKNKRRYPRSHMVVDADGIGRELWKFESKSSAIVIVDAAGSVRYLKDGAMSEPEIEQALKLISGVTSPGTP